MFFPRDRQCSVVYRRQCIVGFRSTDIVMWDLEQRNEVFRCDCGNWRRAFDLKVDLGACDGNGPLVIERLLFVFWRAGRLFIMERGRTKNNLKDDRSAENGPKEAELNVQSIGPAFHGQRVNAIDLIPSVSDGEEAKYVMTGGEDTVLRVMRIDETGLGTRSKC